MKIKKLEKENKKNIGILKLFQTLELIKCNKLMRNYNI